MDNGPVGPSGSTNALADALWHGVRHRPAIPAASGGLRGWYLGGPYAAVVARRRARVWAHRSPEPWLSAQWLMDRAAGAPTTRAELRFEGFPGQHSYEDAYAAVANGLFRAPFVYVAGYARSGTTSVQNLVLAAFPNHVPPGRWSDADHPLRLWWYPKHDAAVARTISELGSDVARVVLCVRPFLDAAASAALYAGVHDPLTITRDWVAEQVRTWKLMADLAVEPTVVSVPFAWLPSSTPAELTSFISDQLGVPRDREISADATWDSVYENRISPEVIDDPQVGNLPHAARGPLTKRLRDRIGDLLGPAVDVLDESYIAAVSA